MIPAVLKGKTVLATATRCLCAVAALLLIAVLAWSLFTGRFWQWRADVWKGRAEDAGQAAAQAKANADSANAAAANATTTRQQMDAAVEVTRAETKRSVERIKTHAPAVAVPAAPVDPRILREFEAGDRAYRAASDRLLGTSAR